MILRVVHHNADPDGIMSATLAKYLYRKDNLMFLGLPRQTTIEFCGYNYETKAAWMNLADIVQYKFVFIDITPTIEWLESVKERIADKTVSVQIFDHHHLKYNDILETHIPVEYHFSDRWCGSKIFYDWIHYTLCNGDEQTERQIYNDIAYYRIHSFVTYVDLYDTWKFVNENTYDETKRKEIIAVNEFLNAFVPDETFRKVMLHYDWETILKTGKVLLHKKDTDCLNQIRNMFIGDGMIVITGSSSYMIQEAIQKCTDKPMLLLFVTKKDIFSNEINLSLRSAVPNTIDCAVEARKFNPTGGGHKEAAGCTVDVEKFKTTLEQVKTFQQENNFGLDKYRSRIEKYYIENLTTKV